MQDLNKLSKPKIKKKWGKWTDKDVYYLSKISQVLTYKEICDLFGLREHEVRGALSYRVKSKKVKKIVWTAEKVKLLKLYYGKMPLHQLALMLKTTESGVLHKVNRLGIRRIYDGKGANASEWKICIDYPNYEISPTGIVRNVFNKRILTPIIKNGYYSVRLSMNGHIYHKSAHRLVAHTYLGDIKGKEVNHIDGNPLNNNVTNLEILTSLEHKFHSKNLRKYYGTKVNTAKLTEDDVRKIRLLSEQGLTQRQIATKFNLLHSTIGRILRGETWKHVT